ncbi:MAG TPA: pilin [Candidatus Saccharimonadales bacterium]|jgi:hypothetical protein|nr:pilin [Candidatus Saccharimonadales bacterium]
MIKTIKISLLVTFLTVFSIVSFMPFAHASAQVNGVKDVCTGIGEAGGSGGGCSGTAGVSLGNTLRNVISVMSILIGVIAVIMIIVGGFKYVTSGGESNRINSAKNTIIYALVGLVIAALAQVLVHFVLHAAT